ncbi:MAG: DNA-directed RNA polymerase subunit omega [Bacteroidetes bacterium]|nr:DNA-directed RNA polymerase subunit omega [Bacteroidota bacterium]
MPLKPIDLEYFNQTGKNVHECIVATSKRARQINEEIKIEFNQRVELITTKTESEAEENDINPDQLKISIEFEKRPKPADTALEHLLDNSLTWKYKEKEQVVAPKEDETPEEEENEE